MSGKASIIIGLGFGDEGKGLATDFLCSQANKPLVIRFNGGQQAGHTVCLPDGRRHVFSSFGSGTLRGAASYWSAYCTLALPNLLNEYKALLQLNVSPQLYIDEHCAITTHYDILYNRLQEQQRNNAKHGSCGMGFGATVQRTEMGVVFSTADLLFADVCVGKLKAIKTYYAIKAKAELNIDFNAFEHDAEDTRFMDYVTAFNQLINHAFFVTTEAEIFVGNQWNNYVFEGAQGILLDMDLGFFPHVTRSNTTSKNALQIINRNKQNIASAEIFYITRVYHTRHGEGPFVQQSSRFSLTNNAAETNVFNDYQGNFRVGPLDIKKVQYALAADAQISNGITKNLLITCIDHVDERSIIYTNDNEVCATTVHKIPTLLQQPFSKVLLSKSPYAAALC